MIRKVGFVMAINLDGNITELYNCCGLKECTIDMAVKDGISIMNRNKRVNLSRFGKYDSIKKAWENVKPVYVKYTEVDENNHVVSANNIIYI